MATFLTPGFMPGRMIPGVTFLINGDSSARSLGYSPMVENYSPRCATFSSDLNTGTQLGMGSEQHPGSETTPEESDRSSTPHENRSLSDIPEQEYHTFSHLFAPFRTSRIPTFCTFWPKEEKQAVLLRVSVHQ